MKFIHLSDLHLGKRFHSWPLLEDQAFILHSILTLCDLERPDAVVIAGDLYDKSVPPVEAVQLLDRFLVALSEKEIPTLLISGNHDSPERVAFGGRLMEARRVWFSPVYDGAVEPVTLRDEYGPVQFYLLPFLKPAHVRRFFPEAQIESYTDALRTAIGHMERPAGVRTVLVTHQFVTGAERSESEELSVGGSDNVDAAVFDGFDYVALGHLHRPQWIGRETVRYCGTPLAYDFSEAAQEKSVTVVELDGTGQAKIRTVPLVPLRKLRALRGSYEELTRLDFYRDTDYRESYLRIVLTDEEDIPEAFSRLRVIYPYLMRLDYDNTRTRTATTLPDGTAREQLSPPELFAAFFAGQNGREPEPEQQEYMEKLMESIWEEEL